MIARKQKENELVQEISVNVGHLHIEGFSASMREWSQREGVTSTEERKRRLGLRRLLDAGPLRLRVRRSDLAWIATVHSESTSKFRGKQVADDTFRTRVSRLRYMRREPRDTHKTIQEITMDGRHRKYN